MQDPSEEEPSSGSASLGLSPPERTLLLLLRGRLDPPFEESELASESALALETVRGSLQRLRAKRLAVSQEEHQQTRRLTGRGRDVLGRGLPERRLLRDVSHTSTDTGPPQDASELTEEERSAAIGILRRRGYLLEGFPLQANPARPSEAEFPEEVALRALSEGKTDIAPEVFRTLQRRGLVEVDHRTERRWSASEDGRSTPITDEGQALGPLTIRLLASGAWRDRPFRPYDVRAAAPRVSGARPHPYLAWVREFEEILIGLGFVEARGPLLESEFWNADVLFMPQEHPARSIQDVFSVNAVEARPPPVDLLERVAAVHEGRPIPGEADAVSHGWRTPYDRAVSRRSVLRSHTTSVSARVLSTHPKPPFRRYCLDRNFRRDPVDATHHVEFGQCEGIIGEEGTSLRELVGIFQALADAIGIRELKIRPSYFPFTEPSIEGYVRHPRLGWIEVFPGGMFRPEVLRPLGIEVPVAAWGIGITRLAMVALGVSDIRDLFNDDLGKLTRGPA